jgi:cyclase
MTTHQSAPLQLDRRSFLAFLGAAAGSAAIATPALAKMSRLGESGALMSSEGMVLKWDQIKPGFHAMVDLNTGGNAMVMTSGSSAILIDTKFAYIAGALKQDASLQAGDPTDLDLSLINTHHHGDHTGGNALIVPHASASYAHENAINRITDQLDRFKQGAQSGPSQIRRSKGSDELMKLAMKAAEESENWTAKDIAPRNPIKKSESISIGDETVSLHHFGNGHTDNDLLVHFENANIVHTGDLVFNGLHPFFDQSAGVTASGWIKSLNGILDRCDKDTIVVPGHGPVADRTVIETQISYVQGLLDNVQRQLDKGNAKAEIRTMSWDFMDGLGFESLRERAIDAVCDELSS